MDLSESFKTPPPSKIPYARKLKTSGDFVCLASPSGRETWIRKTLIRGVSYSTERSYLKIYVDGYDKDDHYLFEGEDIVDMRDQISAQMGWDVD